MQQSQHTHNARGRDEGARMAVVLGMLMRTAPVCPPSWWTGACHSPLEVDAAGSVKGH